MRWVKWSERAPTVADADQTRYVITRNVHNGEFMFQCTPHSRSDIQGLYWLEGANDPVDTQSAQPFTQPTTHIRKVEL